MSRRTAILLSLLVVAALGLVIPKYVGISSLMGSAKPPAGRALAAVGEISALLTGDSATPAEAAFANGGWVVTHQGVRVGLLSAFPSFQSILSLLEVWADHE